MTHRYPELTQRDRYQIGDWVLNNGKPYQWTADDYNRSRLGMQSIKPMPMSSVVLVALGMKTSNGMYNENGVCCNHMFLGDKDPFCDAYIYAVNIYEYICLDACIVEPARYVLNASHNYDSHNHSFIGNVNNVHELQAALRSVQLYDIAEGINMEQAETLSDVNI